MIPTNKSAPLRHRKSTSACSAWTIWTIQRQPTMSMKKPRRKASARTDTGRRTCQESTARNMPNCPLMNPPIIAAQNPTRRPPRDGIRAVAPVGRCPKARRSKATARSAAPPGDTLAKNLFRRHGHALHRQRDFRLLCLSRRPDVVQPAQEAFRSEGGCLG